MSAQRWQFEKVAGPYKFTEGPVWNGNGVLFTDIPESRIMYYEPTGGTTEVFRLKTNAANGLTLSRDGDLYACEVDGRCIARYGKDGTRTVCADRFEGKRLNGPNDLAFDRQGRLWFTDPRYGKRVDDLELSHQSVYRLDPQSDGMWAIHRVTFDTTKPNGILVSQDQSRLYVAQTDPAEDGKQELRVYPINEDGTLGQYKVLHNFSPNRGIDGMCLDEEGNIVATAGSNRSGPGPMIYIFAPNGRVLETHPLPVDMPTNCTFGDPDLKTLYVTASACLYRARTERKGYQLHFR